MAPGIINRDDNRSLSSQSDASETEDFPQPRAKRRKHSTDEDVETRHSTTYNVPSRVLKTTRIQSPPVIKPQSPIPAISTIQTTDADFESINVSPWLVHSLSALSIHNPTEIQRTCIPEILKGRDCIGGSRTGTGKTIAFAVPILQKWAEDPFGIYAVILTPTRELALQIYEQFVALGASKSLKVTLITGGTEMRPQATALARRPHVIVATPGRLADHVRTSGAETIFGLKRTKVVVLDEADRLLTSGPGSMLPDLNTCLSALPPAADRLTLLFTATVTPEVRALKSAQRPTSKPPVYISEIASDLDDPSSTATLIPATLHQTYLQVPLTHKDAFLHILLTVPSLTDKTPSGQAQQIIIFTNRTSAADILHRTLLSLDHPVTSLHSTLPQSERSRNLASFRAGTARILIATDVASRGLDIPEVSTVINFDVPRNPIDYVHRVGRTARAGRKGTSITFVGQRDVKLILAIEEYVGGKMVEWEEEGVNVETRVVRGRTLKDVGEARMEALRDVEAGKNVAGYRRKIRKDTKRTAGH